MKRRIPLQIKEKFKARIEPTHIHRLLPASVPCDEVRKFYVELIFDPFSVLIDVLVMDFPEAAEGFNCEPLPDRVRELLMVFRGITVHNLQEILAAYLNSRLGKIDDDRELIMPDETDKGGDESDCEQARSHQNEAVIGISEVETGIDDNHEEVGEDEVDGSVLEPFGTSSSFSHSSGRDAPTINRRRLMPSSRCLLQTTKYQVIDRRRDRL